MGTPSNIDDPLKQKSKCLHCNKPISNDQMFLFGEVVCCKECYDTATLLYKRAKNYTKWYLKICKDTLSAALLKQIELRLPPLEAASGETYISPGGEKDNSL